MSSLNPALTYKTHRRTGCTVANAHQSRIKHKHKEKTEAQLQEDVDHKCYWNDRERERAEFS